MYNMSVIVSQPQGTCIMVEVTPREPADFLAGGSEMAELIRAMDWSQTPLGPVATWPQSLRTTVSVCLSSRFPILIWWGADLIMLYNDAYRPILGATKHPHALGAPGRRKNRIARKPTGSLGSYRDM